MFNLIYSSLVNNILEFQNTKIIVLTSISALNYTVTM